MDKELRRRHGEDLTEKDDDGSGSKPSSELDLVAKIVKESMSRRTVFRDVVLKY